MELEIIEEVVVEETPVEEMVTDSGQEPEAIIAIPLTMYGTRAQLEVIARHRGYADEISRPDITPETPIQDRFMPNPVDPITWVTAHAKEVMANLVAEAFVAQAQREEAVKTAQAREHALNLARKAIV